MHDTFLKDLLFPVKHKCNTDQLFLFLSDELRFSSTMNSLSLAMEDIKRRLELRSPTVKSQVNVYNFQIPYKLFKLYRDKLLKNKLLHGILCFHHSGVHLSQKSRLLDRHRKRHLRFQGSRTII